MKKIILVTILMLSYSGLIHSQDGSEGAKIKFDTKVYNYGTIYQKGDGNCQFKFTNTGDQPLSLTAVRSSCGCTVPKWPRKPIMPGDTAKIKVTYDTRRLGPINKQITVRSNAKNGTMILRIKGKVIRPTQEAPKKVKSDMDK